MKFLLKWAIVCLCAATSSAALAKDVALVIANIEGSGFQNERALAGELDSVLQAYQADGFEVIAEREADSARMLAAVERFDLAIRDADRIVIHFMGTIRSTRQGNFLRPKNPTAQTATAIYRTELTAELVYDLLSYRPGQAALVVASPTPNIAQNIVLKGKIPNGLLILVGSGLEVNRAVRDGLLKGESGTQLSQRAKVTALGFVSNLSFSATAQPTRPQAQDTAADAALVEMRVWRDAAQNGSREALQAYVDRYPNGLFRGEAQARINALAPAKSLEQTAEESLSLNRADRRRIQRNLTLMGFDTRGVDGVFGRGSRAAIERWQRSEGFRATGYLDGAQIRVLNEAARAKEEANRVTRERDDLAYWQQTGSGTSEQGLRDYLARYPDGLFSTQAKQALERVQERSPSQPNQAAIQRENALNMNAQTRALVEQRLTGLGYNVGPADGNFTNETRIAIRDFQQKAGITPTGYMDNQTVTKLVASIFR